MWRVDKATKGHLTGMVFDSLGREFIARHITGGTKTSSTGGRLAIPVNIPRTGTGRIPKARKPRAITAKKSTRIVRGKTGNNLIIEKFKGQSIVRYVLAPSAKIERSFRFYQDGERVIQRVFSGHWNSAMQRAFATSKYWS
jgi:hypothetical protein